MAMTLLPRFFILENGGKYFRLTDNVAASVPKPGLLKFDEEQIWNPRVKFAVEQAETGDRRQVHIRSCYNNKYWETVRVVNSAMIMIVASATKPEEDRSKDSCTLFEVTAVSGSPNAVLLKSVRHFNAGRLRSINTQNLEIIDGVSVSNGNGGLTVFTVTDWETLVILPTQVSFRSEELNGNYLCSRSLDPRWPYQRFESGVDVGDPLVAKELFPTPNGNYRIKDVHFGRFWRRSPNWIWADALDNNNSNDTVFSIVKISDNVIALRNLGNNKFCGGLTTEGKTDCLNAEYPTLSRQARLMIEERVLDREIFDVRYRLSDSRIYQEEIQEVSHAFAINNSPDHESTIELKYSTSDSRTTHWTHSVSVSVSVTVKFNISIIPLIAEGNTEVSTQVGYEHEWGVSQTTETTREATYTAVVPPLTSMKVTLMCTKGACDVPFSYTQRDLLTTGEWVTTPKDDGIYTGINSYNFYFQSSEVPKDDQGRVFFEDPPSS